MTSKNIIITIASILIISGLIIASGVAGYKWKAADYAETVAALNVEIYEQGVTLQNKTNIEAETNRKLKIANRGRIDAIKLNDHNTNEVTRLQNVLDKSVRELAKTRADRDRLIVLNVNAINRVYDEARNECNGLPDANDSPVVSAQLSQFTGDSVTAVVRYLVARYCEVATDYNGLYEHTEGLLVGIKKPAR